jgi:hypothetical protein
MMMKDLKDFVRNAFDICGVCSLFGMELMGSSIDEYRSLKNTINYNA